jgi:hypothetical protein
MVYSYFGYVSCFLNLAKVCHRLIGFGVLMVARMKMAVFWVVVPCSLVEVYQTSTGLHSATSQKTAIFMP